MKLFKPYKLLLYIQSLLVFFVLGAAFAGYSGVADDQGLAGGAIVFGYGVMIACGAFILSLFAASQLSRNRIIRINQILGVVLIILTIWVYWRISTNQARQQEDPPYNSRPKTTEPADLHIQIHR